MLGGLFAGLEESPGDLILYQGRSFKTYRGMGRWVRWFREAANDTANP